MELVRTNQETTVEATSTTFRIWHSCSYFAGTVTNGPWPEGRSVWRRGKHGVLVVESSSWSCKTPDRSPSRRSCHKSTTASSWTCGNSSGPNTASRRF